MSHDQYGPSGQQNSYGGPSDPNQSGWRDDSGQSGWRDDSGQSGNQGQGGWANPSSQPSASYPSSQPSAPYQQEQIGGYQNQGFGDQPSSQSSAAYPSSQPSAAYPPSSQPSAAYLGSEYGSSNQGAWSAEQTQQNQSTGWGQQHQGAPQHQGGQQNQAAQWGQQQTGGTQPMHQKGLFAKLFDMSFTEYATPGLVKILYILGVALGVLYWLGSAIWMFGVGASMSGSYGTSDTGGLFVVLGFVTLIVGLVPLAFWIIGLRLSLEFMLATVRTQEDTRALRARTED